MRVNVLRVVILDVTTRVVRRDKHLIKRSLVMSPLHERPKQVPLHLQGANNRGVIHGVKAMQHSTISSTIIIHEIIPTVSETQQ